MYVKDCHAHRNLDRLSNASDALTTGFHDSLWLWKQLKMTSSFVWYVVHIRHTPKKKWILEAFQRLTLKMQSFGSFIRTVRLERFQDSFFLGIWHICTTYQTKDDVILSRFHTHNESWNPVVKASDPCESLSKPVWGVTVSDVHQSLPILKLLGKRSRTYMLTKV